MPNPSIDALTEITPLHVATATEAATQPFIVLQGAPVGANYPGRFFVRVQYFNRLRRLPDHRLSCGFGHDVRKEQNHADQAEDTCRIAG